MERLGLPETLRARLDGLLSRVAGAPDPSPDCAACGDTRWRTIVDGEGIPRAVRCACDVPTHADGVPVLFQGALIENYLELPGNGAARDLARGFLAGRRDAFLFGPVGSGKTRLACSLLNEHVRARHTGYFARCTWMLEQLQPGRDEDDAIRRRLETTSLLVIDDVGAERDQATDYTRRTLASLYEQRHDRGLRTVFTSNLSLQALAEHQGDRRLASRLVEQADIVELTTPDQRRARRGR
jgi:chromosomal replication initiation ATPase DnaA